MRRKRSLDIRRRFHGRDLQHLCGWVGFVVKFQPRVIFTETVIFQNFRLAPPFDDNDAFDLLNDKLLGGLSKVFLGGQLVVYLHFVCVKLVTHS